MINKEKIKKEIKALELTLRETEEALQEIKEQELELEEGEIGHPMLDRIREVEREELE